MSISGLPTFFRLRWPEAEVPSGTPVWFHYEVDRPEDAVVRPVKIFANGKVARNSVEIEQRNGADCPSLIDMSLREGFGGMEIEPMSRESFDELWAQGVDSPFWNVS